MNARDIVLSIILLNEKRGRRLNERGVVKIASNVGLEEPKVLEVIEELKGEGLIREGLALTEVGWKEAERSLSVLEKEIKKGPFGFIKWLSFKSKLTPDSLKGSCLGAPPKE